MITCYSMYYIDKWSLKMEVIISVSILKDYSIPAYDEKIKNLKFVKNIFKGFANKQIERSNDSIIKYNETCRQDNIIALSDDKFFYYAKRISLVSALVVSVTLTILFPAYIPLGIAVIAGLCIGGLALAPQKTESKYMSYIRKLDDFKSYKERLNITIGQNREAEWGENEDYIHYVNPYDVDESENPSYVCIKSR